MESLVQGDQRIKFFFETIRDDELADFFVAADCVVAAYSGFSASASGVATLAASFGKPVVAPKTGCIPEQLGDTSLLYDPKVPNGLRLALEKAATSDLTMIGAKNLAKVQNLSWNKIAQKTAMVYQSAFGAR